MAGERKERVSLGKKEGAELGQEALSGMGSAAFEEWEEGVVCGRRLRSSSRTQPETAGGLRVSV